MFKARETVKPTITNITPPPHVYIMPLALSKMKYYVELCSKEIGWLGEAYMDKENNTYYIKDVMLFDQEVHSTTCEITSEGLSKFAEKLLEQKNGMDIWNNLTMWGHSHVNMGVSPSSQDNQQMIVFKDGGHKWFLRIIANKSGELELSLFDYANNLVYSNIPWEMYYPEPNNLEELIKAEIEEKVKEITYTTTYSGYNNWQKNKIWDHNKREWTQTEENNLKKKEKEKEIKKKEKKKEIKKKEINYVSRLDYDDYGYDVYNITNSYDMEALCGMHSLLTTGNQHDIDNQCDMNDQYGTDDLYNVDYMNNINDIMAPIKSIDDVLEYFSYKHVLVLGELQTFESFKEMVISLYKYGEYLFDTEDLTNIQRLCQREVENTKKNKKN